MREKAKEKGGVVMPARDIDSLSEIELSEVRLDEDEDQNAPSLGPSPPPPSPSPSPSPSAPPPPPPSPQPSPQPPSPSPQPRPDTRLGTVDSLVSAIRQLHPLERAALAYELTASEAIIQNITIDHVLDYLRRLNASPAVLEVLKKWLDKIRVDRK